jgi:hypothetical protein
MTISINSKISSINNIIYTQKFGHKSQRPKPSQGQKPEIKAKDQYNIILHSSVDKPTPTPML